MIDIVSSYSDKTLLAVSLGWSLFGIVELLIDLGVKFISDEF